MDRAVSAKGLWCLRELVECLGLSKEALCYANEKNEHAAQLAPVPQ